MVGDEVPLVEFSVFRGALCWAGLRWYGEMNSGARKERALGLI